MSVLFQRQPRLVFSKRKRLPHGTIGASLIAASIAWIALGYIIAPPSMPSAIAAETTSSILATSVYDGDTFRIGAERVRVLGMDAPEIGDGAKCAREHRDAVKARDFLANEISINHVQLTRTGKDSYGRTLAHVHVNGRNIAEVMIAAGLAKPYSASQHGRWCETVRG